MAKSKTKKPTKKSTAKKIISKKPVKKVAQKSPKKAATKKPTKAIARKSTPTVSKTTKSAKVTNIKWQDFVTPLDDRLIVQLDSHQTKTAGGLFIPETSSAKAQMRGTVLVVGRGHRDQKGHLRPMDVKAGDLVVFEEYTGSKASLNGVDVRIMRESEILAIVEK